MSQLNGKIALVTGASKGPGASIAKHMAAAGATVVVNYATGYAGADKVVSEITSAGGKASAIQGTSQNRTKLRVPARTNPRQQRGFWVNGQIIMAGGGITI